ncbi:MAG: hypothetical protein KGJ13_07855, partial [Patescibacteria group bacterium]|nr:hypothetical protein [Patescibacteria group bacterium]
MRKADETIGKIGTILDEFAKKDAIHIAVAPVVAGEKLQKGARVGLNSDGKAVFADNYEKSVGIVDPFLRNDFVKKDERFYIFLYPGTITDLRHEWYHPSFPEEAKGIDVKNRDYAQQWIRHWAENTGLSYDEAMEAAHGYVDNDDYLC